MPRREELDKHRRLMKAVKRVAEANGLSLEEFSFAVPVDDENDMLNMTFVIKPETIVGAEVVEQHDFNQKFEDLIGSLDLGNGDSNIDKREL